MGNDSSSGDVLPITGDSRRRPLGQVEVETVVYNDDTDPGEPESFVRPTTIGRYMVLDLIGVGGMGVVCTAYDPKLDRKVALKLLRDRGGKKAKQNPTGQGRLVREAQALAQLNHPNIVTVHDVDTYEDTLFMAMEYVEGRNLADWLEERPRQWREVVSIFDHAATGLAAAHAAGITHRDFKPANVLIGRDGRVRVVDFGLAKSRDDDDDSSSASNPKVTAASRSDIMEMISSVSDQKLTQAGRIVGTPAYMAPEQHLGAEVGPATDQFSFAVGLYESLYGKLPFAGADADEVFWHVTEGIVEDPPRDCEVPAWLFHRVIVPALRPKPDERFPSMDAVLLALRADPAKRRRRLALWASGAAVVAGGAASVVYAASLRSEPCQGGDARLAGVWDTSRAAAVRSALEATGASYATDTADRVSAGLDAYTEEWLAQHKVVCEATQVYGDQSEVLLDVRMACLERRRGELGALVEVLGDADGKVVEKAMAAVQALRPADPCATAQPTAKHQLPEDPETRRRVLAVRERLDKAKALVDAGKYKSAATIAAGAAELAKELPHLPTRALALLLHGQTLAQTDDPKTAADVLRAAIVAAAEAQHAALEARAWSKLLFVVGIKLGQPDEALGFRLATQAAAARVGADERLLATVHINLGGVLLKHNSFDEALVEQRKGLQHARNALGDAHLVVAKASSNLGITLAKTEHLDEAEKHLRRGLEITTAVVGPQHPAVAPAAINLGNALVHARKLDEAEAEFNRALSVRTRVLGPDHSGVGTIHMNLANVHRYRGEAQASLDAASRALTIFRASLRPEHPRIGKALNTMGSALSAMKRFDEARDRFREAVTLFAAIKPDHLQVGRSRTRLCEAELALGNLEAAVAQCRLAIEILEKAYDGPHSDIDAAKLALVKALWRDRSARAEVDRILAEIKDGPAAHEVKLWIDANR